MISSRKYIQIKEQTLVDHGCHLPIDRTYNGSLADVSDELQGMMHLLEE